MQAIVMFYSTNINKEKRKRRKIEIALFNNSSSTYRPLCFSYETIKYSYIYVRILTVNQTMFPYLSQYV